MRIGPQRHIPSSACRSCGSPLDAATGVNAALRPYPGAASVCAYCGRIMIFAGDLSLREPTEEEMKAATKNEDVLKILWAVAVTRKKQ